MFTGIVEEVGRVCSVRKRDDGIQFDIQTKKISSGLKVDNSIAVNGNVPDRRAAETMEFLLLTL